MPVRSADAEWTGTLKEGSGTFRVGSGALEGAYTWATRFGEDPGTNPEELIGAAEASCFSMALASDLEKAGYTPETVTTSAKVHLERGDAGFSITRIHLTTEARVTGVGEDEFRAIAETTKSTCPVSRALAATAIEVTATLAG